MISRGPALRDQVYENLRDRIVTGELKPGELLVEVELAASLNVSRTPVSNAMVMLKERGLLEEKNGKLAVPMLRLEDVVNLYWCRMALDGMAARIAATRITAQDLKKLGAYLRSWESSPQDELSALWVSDLKFHQHIYAVSGNPHLVRFSQMAAELAAVYRRNTFRRMTDPSSGTSRSLEDMHREHQAILEALIARDADRAESAAREHIQMVIQHLEQADLMLEVPEELR